ncbi:signal peptidase II [Nocardioides sp.]|uniref:signal peptidase II n=1 Tax=Nocardioides sp. TaxID=35761 RepID=UPI002B27953F|nr:signal peptidase II [Nocardioides sp.]
MQAARGTSIGTAATDGSRRRRAILLFVLVALTAYAVDQVTKVVAVAELEGRSDVQVLGDLLQLNLVRNPGAAFSIGTSLTPLLSALAAVAALTVLWLSRRLGSKLWAVGLGLLLAGVLGNLTDRVLRAPGAFRGHVIDFLQLPNWPIFNVADICINVAAGLIILQAFRGIRLDGTRESDLPDPPDPTDQEAVEADPDKDSQ